MTDEAGSIVLEVFEAVQSRGGEPGHDGKRGKSVRRAADQAYRVCPQT